MVTLKRNFWIEVFFFVSKVARYVYVGGGCSDDDGGASLKTKKTHMHSVFKGGSRCFRGGARRVERKNDDDDDVGWTFYIIHATEDLSNTTNF